MREAYRSFYRWPGTRRPAVGGAVRGAVRVWGAGIRVSRAGDAWAGKGGGQGGFFFLAWTCGADDVIVCTLLVFCHLELQQTRLEGDVGSLPCHLFETERSTGRGIGWGWWRWLLRAPRQGGLIQDGERKDTEATCWSETSGGCSVRIVLGTRPSVFLFSLFFPLG